MENKIQNFDTEKELEDIELFTFSLVKDPLPGYEITKIYEENESKS